MICCPWAYSKSLTQLYPFYLAHILRFFCVTCGVKMMSLCHGWGCQPPQTASRIHISHIQSVWAHWFAIQLHTDTTVAALHSYTHPTGSDFGVHGHLWSQNDVIMSRLRLTATSNCFPHPYYTYTKCLSTLICCAWTTSSSLTQLYPSYLAQILGFWDLWLWLWSQTMSICHGWGWGPDLKSNRFPHPY